MSYIITRAFRVVLTLSLLACHSEEAKKDPATQKTGTVTSPAEAGAPDPGPPPPGPTLQDELKFARDWAAFLDEKFEADASADATAKEAESQMKAKAAEVKANATDATITIDGPSCKANFCRAKVTFGSLQEREKYRNAFGGAGGAFFGRWSVVDIVVGDTEVKFYVGLKGGELPMPQR